MRGEPVSEVLDMALPDVPDVELGEKREVIPAHIIPHFDKIAFNDMAAFILQFTALKPLSGIVGKHEGQMPLANVFPRVELPLIHFIANCVKQPAGPLPGVQRESLLIGVEFDPPLTGPGKIDEIAFWGS
jgi:hypothetical protein